jgi:transcriptional regulator with XRE-family HTH domain
VASPGQTLRRRKLSKALSRLRQDAGLSVRDLAGLTRLGVGTISRIESGQHTIVPRNVQHILQTLKVGEAETANLLRIAEESEGGVSWWLTFSDTVPDWFRDYVDLETDADAIHTYNAELVDGLLQTPDYALAVAQAGGLGMTAEQLERFVRLREARQANLDRVRLHVVMGEAALRVAYGSEDVMREQFARLVELGDRGNITIQVLPFCSGGHAAAKGPFTLLQFPEGFDDTDCVYLENENGGVWQERPSDIARYSDVFSRVARQAISHEETRALLVSLA